MDTSEKSSALWLQERDLRKKDFEQREKEFSLRISDALGRSDWSKTVAVSARDLRQWLPDRTVFVDFVSYRHYSKSTRRDELFATDERFVVFVTTPRQRTQMIPLEASGVQIKNLVDEWRSELKSRDDFGRPRANLDVIGEKLTERIWKPLMDRIEQLDIDNFVISADGSLWAMPFAAIPSANVAGGRPSQFLVVDKTISYVLSGRQLADFLRPRTGERSNGRLAVFGDIQYADDEKLEPVPNGDTRINRIVQMWSPDERPFLRVYRGRT